MEIEFRSASMEECGPLVARYLERLTGPFDNYLESHILRSEFFEILSGGKVIGYYALCNTHSLTQFYLEGSSPHAEQEVFSQIIQRQRHMVEMAIVPTCDAPLLALCLKDHARTEAQALTFAASGRKVPPPEFPRALLHRVEPHELDVIHEITDNLFELYGSAPQADGFSEIYALRDGDEVMGYGLRESLQLFPGHESLSVFTLPRHREQGVGRSILMHLRAMAKERGHTPITGCWYYNRKGKKMLSSAGFDSTVTIRHIYFH